MESINRALPQGLRVREMQLLGTTMPRLSRWTRYGLYRVKGEGEESYVLLSLSGKGQGRLKDALEAMGTRLRGPGGGAEVTRVGLYASREEVYEDARGTVYYYEPGKRELEKMVGD